MDRSDQRSLKLIALLAGGAAVLYYGIGTYRISKDVSRRESIPVVAGRLQDSSLEVGVVVDEFSSDDYKQGRRYQSWTIKIPSTNRRWSSSWDAGYHNFRRGDTVVLAHWLDESGNAVADNNGLLLEFVDDAREKHGAYVTVNDADDADMDEEIRSDLGRGY